MIRILIFFIFVNLAVSLFVDCQFSSFDSKNPPVFVQEIVNGHRLLSSDKSVVFPHEAVISAYCNAKVVDNGDSTNEIVNLECNNGTIKDLYNQYVSCEIEGYYRYRLEECPEGFLSYVSGLKLENTFVIFQAVCFDDVNLHTVFVKYIPKRRSDILSFQTNINPVDADTISTTTDTLKMSFVSFEVLGDENITEQIRPLVGGLESTLVFTESSLVPLEFFKPYFNHQNKINTVIWWKALRDGNWAFLQERLRQLDDVEVYAGTSGIAAVINDYNEPVELWLQKTHGPVVVPLYIWNYVKFKSATDEDVVIIGVNSPFVQNHLSVCREDVCYRKRYLADMPTKLKYPALGYIICCEPNDVNLNIIHGIPNKLLAAHATTKPKPIPYPPQWIPNLTPSDLVINTPRPRMEPKVCYGSQGDNNE